MAARDQALVEQDRRIAQTLDEIYWADVPSERRRLHAVLTAQLRVRKSLVFGEETDLLTVVAEQVARDWRAMQLAKTPEERREHAEAFIARGRTLMNLRRGWLT